MPTPEREQLIQQLLLRFRKVFQSVRSHIRFPELARDLGGAEITLMMRLGRESDGVSVKDLAADMGITSGAVSQLVDKLMEKGLINRVEDNKDRRIVRIVPSEKAYQMRRDLKDQFYTHLQTLFSDLTDDELTQFINLLNKVKTEQKAEE